MQIRAFSKRSYEKTKGSLYFIFTRFDTHFSKLLSSYILPRFRIFFYFLHPCKESNVSSFVDTVNFTIFQKVMHQSIPAGPSSPPPAPRATAGHLPAFSVLEVGHLQILCCPGAEHLPTPGPFPSFCHARGFLSGLLGKKADSVICHGQEKIEEVVIAYQARITWRNRELST